MIGGGSVRPCAAAAAAVRALRIRVRIITANYLTRSTTARLRWMLRLLESVRMRLATFALLALWAPLYSQDAVKVRVDATDAPRRLFHVQMSMPAKAGAMTLLYPEWIPGEHGPTGPIAN